MFSEKGAVGVTYQQLKVVLLVLIAVGVIFRFVNLAGKVYWHDETYTSLRAAGYTRQEIDDAVFQNQTLPAAELQRFQDLKPDSTVSDTVRSLMLEDPHHPPFYFVMARGWMHVFGGSMLASRFFPALLSLLSLPLMYWLGMELFASPLAALLATTLLALSPFDVLFAQTARQYSLLTALTIAGSWQLLRSLRSSNWPNWLGYGLINAIGLYTHPFFTFGVVAQGAYVLLRQFVVPPAQVRMMGGVRKLVAPWLGYAGAIALALLLYAPWTWVMIANSQRLTATTDWARVSPGFGVLARLWSLSFTSLFFDLDVGFDDPVTYLFRLPFLMAIALAFYTLLRKTHPAMWLFLLLSSTIPFLMLVIPDVIVGGKRSGSTRYLLACFPAIQLAVGFWLSVHLSQFKAWWRRVALALFFAASVASLSVSALATTWWCKDLSYFNGEIAEQVNGLSAPVLVSDVGDDFTNTGDLLSLSYELSDRVVLLALQQPIDLAIIERNWSPDMRLFRPSGAMFEALRANGWTVEATHGAGRLFSLQRPPRPQAPPPPAQPGTPSSQRNTLFPA
ncbi:glycosyltransferase family 39 protein [Leptolyngbya sp. AN02str]|uniref:glycosyltransferase family 39 protein n=1 Tax=Leptolyngbya sp. AN02str TaxID=3423363 RepID=UPI003D321ACF